MIQKEWLAERGDDWTLDRIAERRGRRVTGTITVSLRCPSTGGVAVSSRAEVSWIEGGWPVPGRLHWPC
jgi:hypothetical protein